MKIVDAKKLLKEIGLSLLEVLLLLEYILKIQKEYIIVNDDLKLNEKQKKLLKESINQLKNNTPLRHIIKNVEFMSLNFYVNSSVLIARSETENLVEEAINLIKENNFNKILDLCCGSGAIGLSLAYYTKKKIILSDISKRALVVSRKNAQNLKLEDLVEIKESNLLESFKGQSLDLIITNPPYLTKQEFENKEKREVKKALIGGGKRGISIAKKIIKQAEEILKNKGIIIIELSPKQIREFKEWTEKNYKFIFKKIIYDIEERERALVFQKV